LSKIAQKSYSIPALIATCLLLWSAQAQGRSSSKVPPGERLRMVVILSRHGVRSPTWTQARLNSYSAQPWPTWSVPPADLTPRGHQLLVKFGSFDRAWLAASGINLQSGCAGAASVYIWVDTAERTIESGHALAEGLLPGCAIPLHGLPEGEPDPLFHPAPAGVNPAQADAASAALATRLDQPQNSYIGTLVDQIRHLLAGCDVQTACKATSDPENAIPSVKPSALREKGDRLVDIDGPLPVASSFVEDLLLEYVEGMPMTQVGWGRVDEAQLRRLLALHTAYFDLVHRTPAIARLEASNLLFHIARTLQQGAEGKPVDQAIGPQGAKVVLLVGHDTNLASLGALLGVHWRLDGRNDDTPPGMEMRFELWQDARGAYSVRLAAAVQTLHQLREASTLTLGSPPASVRLVPLGASGRQRDIPWSEFEGIANSAIASDAVLPMKAEK
jgi:4-phytase / acid phosphatase